MKHQPFDVNELWPLPLSEEAFEKDTKEVADAFALPLEDNTRMMAIAYFHGLDKTEYMYSPNVLGAFLHKQCSHMATFKIHERISDQRRKDMEDENKTKEEKKKLAIVEQNLKLT